MSTEKLSEGNERLLLDKLSPKILANYAAKLEGLAGESYDTILSVCCERNEGLDAKIRQLSTLSTDPEFLDTAQQEMDVALLCATGNEKEVDIPERQGNYLLCDRAQARTAAAKRDLDYFIANGVDIEIAQDRLDDTERLCRDDERDVPYIEKLKAQRLFIVNGFDNSRVMHAVHDALDHAWLFQQLTNEGVFDRYRDFLDSIDVRSNSFLYSRQAELVASAGFGSRRWQLSDTKQELRLLDEQDILHLLNVSNDDRVANARIAFQGMNPDQKGHVMYVIENMLVQLCDERRRWGAVKQGLGSFDTKVPMNLFDPVYISMLIESVAALQRSNSFVRAQIMGNLGVESVLTEALSKDASGHFTVQVPSSHWQKPELPARHVEWLKRNPHASTVYRAVDG